MVYLGDMLQLPDWLNNLSPFGHIPKVPIGEINIAKILLLVAIAILLIIAGFVGYNKRDIHG